LIDFTVYVLFPEIRVTRLHTITQEDIHGLVKPNIYNKTGDLDNI